MAMKTRFTRIKADVSDKKVKRTGSYSVHQYMSNGDKGNSIEDRIIKNTVNISKDSPFPDPITEIRLRIDKVVFGLNVPLILQEYVLNNIETIVQGQIKSGKAKKTKSKDGYRYTVLFRIINRKINGKKRRITVAVSYRPFRKKVPYILIDFNVSKLRKLGRLNLLELISDMVGPGNVDEILKKSHFTRIELAFDLYGINIGDLLFDLPPN